MRGVGRVWGVYVLNKTSSFYFLFYYPNITPISSNIIPIDHNTMGALVNGETLRWGRMTKRREMRIYPSNSIITEENGQKIGSPHANHAFPNHQMLFETMTQM